MTNLDYSKFNKKGASMAVDVIRRVIDTGKDDDLLISIPSAMNILNNVCQTGDTQVLDKILKELHPMGLTLDGEGNITATADELRRKELHRKKWSDEVRQREGAALGYIGYEYGSDTYTLNEKQVSQSGGLFAHVHGYFSDISDIEKAEACGDQTTDLYDRLNGSILSVREMGVMWLEDHQKMRWGHPITLACRDVANAGSVLSERVGKDNMKGAIWNRFHSSVERLRDGFLSSRKHDLYRDYPPNSASAEMRELFREEVETSKRDLYRNYSPKPAVSNNEFRKLFRREMAVREYVGDESNANKVVFSEIQSRQIDGILGAIWKLRDMLRRIEDAEANDLPTTRLYNSLDEAISEIRRVSVEWLENYRKDYWHSPITQACSDVSNSNFAVLIHVDQGTLNSEEWNHFRDNVEKLYDKCHQTSVTQR